MLQIFYNYYHIGRENIYFFAFPHRVGGSGGGFGNLAESDKIY